jgi:hypothetical protein
LYAASSNSPDILARPYLGRGLSQHPDIGKHVEDIEEVEQMGMWALLTLAKKMGIDSDDMTRKTEQEERELSNYSHKYPAFKGELRGCSLPPSRSTCVACAAGCDSPACRAPH